MLGWAGMYKGQKIISYPCGISIQRTFDVTSKSHIAREFERRFSWNCLDILLFLPIFSLYEKFIMQT